MFLFVRLQPFSSTTKNKKRRTVVTHTHIQCPSESLGHHDQSFVVCYSDKTTTTKKTSTIAWTPFDFWSQYWFNLCWAQACQCMSLSEIRSISVWLRNSKRLVLAYWHPCIYQVGAYLSAEPLQYTRAKYTSSTSLTNRTYSQTIKCIYLNWARGPMSFGPATRS